MAKQVLIVEDEPLVRMDAVSLLATAGLDVVEFDRAEEALRYFRSHADEVAAVFTDINLRGGMDGIDLAQEVSHGTQGPVVVVTSGRFGSRPVGLPVTASFVRKPWTADEVLGSLGPALVAA